MKKALSLLNDRRNISKKKQQEEATNGNFLRSKLCLMTLRRSIPQLFCTHCKQKKYQQSLSVLVSDREEKKYEKLKHLKRKQTPESTNEQIDLEFLLVHARGDFFQPARESERLKVKQFLWVKPGKKEKNAACVRPLIANKSSLLIHKEASLVCAQFFGYFSANRSMFRWTSWMRMLQWGVSMGEAFLIVTIEFILNFYLKFLN